MKSTLLLGLLVSFKLFSAPILMVSVANGKALLVWRFSGVTPDTYQVLDMTTGAPKMIAELPKIKTSYLHAFNSDGTTYKYAVRAVGKTKSVLSNLVSVKSLAPVTAPTGITAKYMAYQDGRAPAVQVFWDFLQGAGVIGYQVNEKPLSSFNWLRIADIPSSQNLIEAPLRLGVTTQYQICTLGIGGTRACGETQISLPGAVPSTPAVSLAGATATTLSLNIAPVQWSESYLVKVAMNQSGPDTIVSPELTAPNVYLIRNLQPDTRYYFKITAHNKLGASAPASLTSRTSALTDDLNVSVREVSRNGSQITLAVVARPLKDLTVISGGVGLLFKTTELQLNSIKGKSEESRLMFRSIDCDSRNTPGVLNCLSAEPFGVLYRAGQEYVLFEASFTALTTGISSMVELSPGDRYVSGAVCTEFYDINSEITLKPIILSPKPRYLIFDEGVDLRLAL